MGGGRGGEGRGEERGEEGRGGGERGRERGDNKMDGVLKFRGQNHFYFIRAPPLPCLEASQDLVHQKLNVIVRQCLLSDDVSEISSH